MTVVSRRGARNGRQEHPAAARPAPAADTVPDAMPDAVPDAADGAAAPLDLLLTDAALGPLRRMLPGGAALRVATALGRRPTTVAGHGRDLAAELARVVLGRSTIEPGRRDKRFTDRGWHDNPLLHRAMQGYLAAAQTARELVGDVELDWRDAQRLGFAVENLVEALAPSNNPVLNPAALKAVIETGGGNVVHGLRRLVSDLSTPPRVPAMVEPDAFTVGVDLAVTPGAVVLRTPVFELLQYRPATPTVRQVPLLVVPPMINKYYVTDLAPGRSVIEHLVGSGHQVFAISWRNPDAEHSGWGLNTYGAAILDAMDAMEQITGTDRSALYGLCSGGIVAAMLLGHLAHVGELHRVAALALSVAVLDQHRAGLPGALLGRREAERAIATSARKGYLDGRSLAEVFAWLRPGDLVWSYWVNNYLLGRPPPAFDVLFWNADTTRMTAALHRDFVEMAIDNALVRPGGVRMLGSPVDLAAVDVDSYITAGVTDHLCRWQNCYASTQLLGGRSRFVLSTSGHIASIINPPGNPKTHYRTAPDNPADPEAWLTSARTQQGSWWPDLVDWLGERCGTDVDAPGELGSSDLPQLGPAPGTYVFAR